MAISYLTLHRPPFFQPLAQSLDRLPSFKTGIPTRPEPQLLGESNYVEVWMPELLGPQLTTQVLTTPVLGVGLLMPAPSDLQASWQLPEMNCSGHG